MSKNLFKKVTSIVMAASMSIMSAFAALPAITSDAAYSDTIFVRNTNAAAEMLYTANSAAMTTTENQMIQCKPCVVKVSEGQRCTVELSYNGVQGSLSIDDLNFSVEDESIARVVKADYSGGFYVEGLKEGNTVITITKKNGDSTITTILPVAVGVADISVSDDDDLSETGIHVVIDSTPTKDFYNLGEELTLEGGTYSVYFNGGGDSIQTIYSEKSMIDLAYIDIDTSAFDNTKHGTYPITITYNHYTGYYGSATFYVQVFDPAATVVTKETSNETTPTTVTELHEIVKDDIGQTTTVITDIEGIMCDVSEIEVEAGKRKSIDLYFANGSMFGGICPTFSVDDPGIAVAQNSDAAWSFYVVGISEGETVITVKDSLNNYETKLKVKVTGQTPEELGNDMNITIDSMPSKLEYNIGEEIDLTGGVFSIDYIYGEDTMIMKDHLSMTDSESRWYIDTSAFDSSQPGVYPIVISASRPIYGSWDVYVFYVTVTDPEAPINGDIDGNGSVGIEDAILILQMYAQTAAGIETVSAKSTMTADINGDGKIDISDATCILNYYARNAAGLPCTWEDIIN